MLGLLAAAAASIAVMLLWVQTPDYQTLYSNLASEDAAAIVEELKTTNIPYKLGARGSLISVPAEIVHEIRLQLASQGLPKGAEVGLEIFDETALGMTEFVQKLNFLRALQGELARTIKSLEAVDQVRVHLVIPEESVFLKERTQGKASVTLKINPGKGLTESQVQGIVHLVSSSIKGVPPGNVTVLDLKGNILSGAREGTQDAMTSSTNFKMKRRVETELETSVRRMLEKALGEGKVIVRVSAQMNFDKVERTEEIFDPDSQVVRSEQRTTESSVGAAPPGGVPGVQALVPGGQTAGAGAGARRNKEKETFNYEINKVLRHVIKPVGEIQKLSISVLIDGTLDEDGQYQPRTSEEMARYLEVVKTAVGFDEQRNDQINVENIQFDKTFLIEQKKEIKQAERIEMGFDIAKYAIGAIFIILFFARIIRPLINFMTTRVEVVPEGTPELLPAEEEEAEDKKRLAELGAASAEIRKTVSSFVESDPQFSASIVRKWLREKRPAGE